MKIVKTHLLTPESLTSETEKLWVYNGLDCCVTVEVLDVMVKQLDNVSSHTYGFSRELQAPILEMNMRGLLVDNDRRNEVIEDYLLDIKRLEKNLNRILQEGIGVNINWNSPPQLKNLLYEHMRLPAQRKRNSKGQYAPSVDRDCLEKLAAGYFQSRPIVSHILAMRDLAKKVSTLQTDIDPDGRMRTNFNIAGTTTGRLSSSLADFGTGGNLQNWEKKLRTIFIADPGKKFANIDLAQADARNVGALCYEIFGATAYLDATESGDLHTTVCRLAWADLDWGSDPAGWRGVADRLAYRHLTYRDLAKKLGHGTNYFGTPQTMAKHTKVERSIIEEFQNRYFAAFPEIKRWHDWVKLQLQGVGALTTPFGRRRQFWGRRTDDTTLREAIAYAPQSMTADEISIAMLNVWRLNVCAIVLQVHDSLVIQYDEDREAEVLAQVLPVFRAPLRIRDRDFCVPCDVQVGWNLGERKVDKETGAVENPDGLTGWKGEDSRKRSPRVKRSLADLVL